MQRSQDPIDTQPQSQQLNSQVNKKQIMFKPNPKTSLCRHFLRGNCVLPAEKCYFAHGIQQLNFMKYDEDKEKDMIGIYRDFRAKHFINQLDDIVDQGNKNYVNLYEFQLSNHTTVDFHEIKNDKIETTIKNEQKIQKKKQKKRGQYEHKVANKNLQQKQQIIINKIYTLEQINNDRNIKIEIRKKFHKNQFKLFLEAIEKVYCNSSEYEKQETKQSYRFAYDILQLEYFRVGFNKLMTRIKFQFIVDFLEYEHKGGHFKFTSIFPPLRSKTATFYLKLAPQQQMLLHYKNVYRQTSQLFQKQNKKIREEDIKQAMMKNIRNFWRIPPLTQMLKIKHCTFKDFLIKYILQIKQNGVNKDEGFQWVTDETIQIIKIREIIEEQIKNKGYCTSRAISNMNPKFSRNLIQKCVSSQRKQAQQLYKKQGNQSQLPNNVLVMIKCPNIKTQIITRQLYLKPQSKYQYQFGITLPIILEDVIQYILLSRKKQQQADVNLSKFNEELLKNVLHNFQELSADTLEMYKIVQISTVSELLQHEQSLVKNSTLLGVDLEGDLSDSENGYLSLIQINHFSQKIIYLIDFLTISQRQTESQITKCKILLTKLFNDPNKVKIIHDSRNDAQCLYSLLKKQTPNQKQSKIQQIQTEPIKFVNIFDTAASQQIIEQIKNKKQGKISTPGLNEVLEKYGQQKNRFKQKFHTIREEGKSDPGVERPMSQQFKQYCAMDVLGLPKLFKAMCQLVNPYFLVLVSQMHADFSKKKELNPSKQKKKQKTNQDSKQASKQSIQ